MKKKKFIILCLILNITIMLNVVIKCYANNSDYPKLQPELPNRNTYDIIANRGTKFSIKINEDFKDLKIKRFIKMPINKRSFKKEDIHWSAIDTSIYNAFFIGFIKDTYRQVYQSSTSNYTSYSYYAKIAVKKLVINDLMYDVDGYIYTTLGNKDSFIPENVFTKNYDIMLTKPLLITNASGTFDENTFNWYLLNDKNKLYIDTNSILKLKEKQYSYWIKFILGDYNYKIHMVSDCSSQSSAILNTIKYSGANIVSSQENNRPELKSNVPDSNAEITYNFICK